MEFAFEVTGAKRPEADAPVQQPMRPSKLVRHPDTDMKKVRRQQARQRKTALVMVSCPECGGAGMTPGMDGEWSVESPCGMCGGSGRVPDNQMQPEKYPTESAEDRYFVSEGTMQREAEILRAMAKASLPEQRALALELDGIRREAAHRAQADRDVDLADSFVRDCLTPVMTHSMHSTATDWIDDVPDVDGAGADDTVMAHAMRTEAALWFRKTSTEVKADRDEFAEQAMGMARVHAGRYGERAVVARQAFLDHAAHLHRTSESGSEMKADPSGQGQSGLPDVVPLSGHDETFDEDFWSDPVSEVSSERAPVVQENKQGQRRVAGDLGPQPSEDEGRYCKTHDVWIGPGNAANHGKDEDGELVCDIVTRKKKTAGEVPPEFKEHQKTKGGGEAGDDDDDGDDKPDWLKKKIEGRRHFAGEVPEQFKKKDDGGGESEKKPEGESTSEAPAAGGDEGEGLTDEEKAELEQLRAEQSGQPAPAAGGEAAPPAEGESKPEEKKEDKGENPFAKKDAARAAADKGSIFCGKCKGQGMVRSGGVVRNCTSCKGTGLKPAPRKKVQDVFGNDYQAAMVRQAEVEGWPLDPNTEEKDDVDEMDDVPEGSARPSYEELPGVASSRREGASYSGDPTWITTRYPSHCSGRGCGQDISAGSRAFYWPKGKLLECESCGDASSRRFDAEVADEDFMNQGFMGTRRQASPPTADPSGQGQSSLPDREVGNKDDRPMWPWELPEDDPETGKDAADVDGTSTPGGESGYPQPKSGSGGRSLWKQRPNDPESEARMDAAENSPAMQKADADRRAKEKKKHPWMDFDAMDAAEERGRQKQATRYCKTHDVWIGEGNAANHDEACKIEDRETQESKESRRRTAAPNDGEQSYCRLCGVQMEGHDYAWYALSASSPKRDVGKHGHVPARTTARPGEFGPDGELAPGTPGGEGGQYDAPAGHIYDAAATPIKVGTRRVAADDEDSDGGGGQTCSVCGDTITRDPAGEEPRTWHHTNGTSHDHEASPSGGESKESKVAAFRRLAQSNLQRI